MLFRQREKKPSRPKVVSIVPVETWDDAAPLTYWAGKHEAARFLIRPHRMLMQGAFSLTSPGHPFIAALHDGKSALKAFYDRFRPNSLAEMYGLTCNDVGADLEPWRLPWIARQTPPSAEVNLDPEDGVSFYGPATARKIDAEMHRLDALRTSIRKHGYQPDQHGDIDGTFLCRHGDFRFFVRGGKHRAAVFAFLHPGQAVPAQMKRAWPRVIDRDGARHWPMVASGSVSRPLAEQIFDRYFDE